MSLHRPSNKKKYKKKKEKEKKKTRNKTNWCNILNRWTVNKNEDAKQIAAPPPSCIFAPTGNYRMATTSSCIFLWGLGRASLGGLANGTSESVNQSMVSREKPQPPRFWPIHLARPPTCLTTSDSCGANISLVCSWSIFPRGTSSWGVFKIISNRRMTRGDLKWIHSRTHLHAIFYTGWLG